MDPKKTTQLILDFCREAGEIALKIQDGVGFKFKGDKSIVSEADLKISKLFHKKYFKTFAKKSDHLLIDEEKVPEGEIKDLIKKYKYIWTLDPIDGTSPYAAGLHNWGILVSVIKDGVPWLGFIYCPAFGELVYTDGEDAFVLKNPFSKNQKKQKLKKTKQKFYKDMPLLLASWFKFFENGIEAFMPMDVHAMACSTSYMVQKKCAGYYARANLWDIAPGWAIGRVTGVGLYEPKRKKSLKTLADIQLNKKWKFIEPYIFASKEILPYILKHVRFDKVLR